MSSLPDPIELMGSRIEREIDKIDKDGNYPCCSCGQKFKAEDMLCVSPLGDGPLVCSIECFDAVR